jgi:pullulanase
MLKRFKRLMLCLGVLLITSLVVAQEDSGLDLPEAGIENPTTVTIAGTIQSVLGCPDDWQPECDVTHLTYDEGDDLWRAAFELPAGEYEYKAALNGTWEVNFGQGALRDGPNIPLVLEEDTTVEFFFDYKTGWVTDNVNSIIAAVPGNYQSEIGCVDTTSNGGDWEPGCLKTWLQDPDGDGTYVYVAAELPEGGYEAKVAVNESWDLNYGAGGTAGGANIPFSVDTEGTPVYFVWDSESAIMEILVGGDGERAIGNLNFAAAHWVTADTIAWNIDAPEDGTYTLHYDPEGAITLGANGVEGGQSLSLTLNPAGLGEPVLAKFPHLADFAAFTISQEDLALVPEILRGQIAVSAADAEGNPIDATSLQIAGVLDDLYTYGGALGVTWNEGVPSLSVWAPTAQNVTLHLFADSIPDTESTTFPMTRDDASGTWSVTGEADWNYQYYLYEVQVYVPQTGQVETNLVTDPYSFSLSTNSTRSQIVDLNDPALIPDGWDTLAKPELNAPEDIVIYELHIRDFSVFDESVPEELRGKYLAFTVSDSNGMNHLRSLAEAGLTHLHLLPSFDLATINENEPRRFEPDYAELASFPPDSDQQQALIDPVRDLDGFNWGYDPYHYTVPEGSYATDPNGAQRILEFRQMVQSINQAGLRVVTDVVYNHTNSAGQAQRSVLDRIVPGYYHRRDPITGAIATSTCCPNTATEHNMMERLMVDSVLTWATAYKVDGYRFDLMGHHMLRNMVLVREALDSLTVEEHGVDGEAIYVYGEGWNFGEVADNARGVNATQLNIAGTGIGVFNDRLRDAVRGGSPFGGRNEQGFITDLYFNPNGTTPGTEEEQQARLILFANQIRIGMAGNLAEYAFVGSDVQYNGFLVAYTGDPQENIIYVSKHDNETLWDIIQYKGLDIPVSEMVRMHNLGLNIVLLSQGVPFFQSGDDLLRSKSLDRNSYNSGDWFNRLDFTYQTNNWGVGLPPEADNGDRWDEMRPLLADPNRVATPEDIEAARQNFLEFLQIRRSSPLFRLQTAEQINAMLTFQNTGDEQIPGLIVMTLTDSEGIDPNYSTVVVLINAQPESVEFTDAQFADMALELHPVLVNSADPVVRDSAFDAASATFTVPGRTAAVFVLGD